MSKSPGPGRRWTPPRPDFPTKTLRWQKTNYASGEEQTPFSLQRSRLQMDQRLLRGFFLRSWPQKPDDPPSGGTSAARFVRLENPEVLLRLPHRQPILHQIAALMALPPRYHEHLVRSTLSRYANFVQRLPASEAHHHAGLGGMLDHGLDVTLQALLIRRGQVLPVGAEPEQIGKLHDLWTYAVFSAAMLHDIAKPAVDQTVLLLDASGRLLGPWDPWSGPMDRVAQCHGYAVRFRRDRRYRLHERSAPLLVHHILPESGLAWLASDPELFSFWLAAISGDIESAGPLGAIIQKADGRSVAKSLGAEEGPRAAAGSTKALWEKLLAGLRYLIVVGELPLNRNGAAGWLLGDDLWLVSKRVIDALRAHLGSEGHAGIPSRNERIYDVLQEHGVLEPCGDRAIWRATVNGSDWSHELTLIRIRAHRIWPHGEDRPEPFEGTVLPREDHDTRLAGHETIKLRTTADMADPDTDSVDAEDEEVVEPEIRTLHPDVPHPSRNQPALPSTVRSAKEEMQERPRAESISSNLSGSPVTSDLAAIEDPGEYFLAWLRHELAHRRLAINSVNARVHCVPEGVLLVSPAIFRDFAQKRPHLGNWESVQKRFLKRKRHIKCPDGTNVHRYRVIGERNQSVIKGILLPASEGLFGEGHPPPPNPHLKAIGHDAS